MRQLILTEDNNQLEIKMEGQWSYADFMTVMLSTLDGQTQQFLASSTKELTDEQAFQLRGSTYDELNYMFGQILERIIPDGNEDFASKLTAEAILRAENEIIKEQYDALPDDVKADNRVYFDKAKKNARAKN